MPNVNVNRQQNVFFFFRSKFKIALDIPKVLRDQLVFYLIAFPDNCFNSLFSGQDKDYESVNVSYKLVSLPSSPSVNELLDTYLSEKRFDVLVSANAISAYFAFVGKLESLMNPLRMW